MVRTITADDVGEYFLGPDGQVWRLIGYASQPTATFERLDCGMAPTRVDGCVGSPILEPFRRLVLEQKNGEVVAGG